MRLHRFYINSPIEQTKILIKDERLVLQWRDVFRYNAGSQVVIFNGSGNEFETVILRLTNREAEVEIVSKKMGILPKTNITLFQSLIKKDKMEWVVEKATELGVSKIVPILSERSEKKGFNIERAYKIAIEASEQCGRADIPEICEIQNLEITLNNTIVSGSVIAFDSSGESLELRAKSLEPEKVFEASSSKLASLSLFIGPEGGWSEKEIEIFRNANAKIYSLGQLTLRAETASVVALSKFC